MSATPRSLVATGAAVLLGIALRIATAYPAHKYAADADCVNCGIVALKILDGHPTVWHVPRRAGSLECWGHALAFKVFGVSREALAIAPTLTSSLTLVVFAALALAWLGPTAGPLATLLFALPPPAYVFWTYMPNGYPETMLLSLLVLLAAERVSRRPDDARWLAVLGLAAGLGFWNSIQTLAATIPAVLWLVFEKRGDVLRLRAVAIAGGAFVLGALPWIAWNVAVPLGSFRDNFSVRPATGLAALEENARYVVRYALPELVASADPENGPNPPSRLAILLRVPVLVTWAAAALYALARAVAALARRLRGWTAETPPETPFLLVALAICAFTVLSGAGAMRGLTVRYVLPVFFFLPAALALAAAAAARASKAGAILAAAAICAVLAFNVSGYFLPGSAARRLWEKRREADSDLVAFLSERGVQAVTGDYWSAYPMNFLSAGRIAGVPFQGEADFCSIERSLDARPLRWAVVGLTRSELERLVPWTGDSGLLAEVGLERWVFIPEIGSQTAPEFLSRYRPAFASAR